MSDAGGNGVLPSPGQLAVAVLTISGIALIAYGAVLDAPFTYDDENNITLNPGIRLSWVEFSSWDRLRLWEPTPRPVANLSFALNYAAGGLVPWGFRAVNVAIHIATSLCVALLAWFGIGALSRRSGEADEVREVRLGFALFAGLLFVAHPLATQSVTYIVQRMTSLSTLFYVAALCLWIAGNRTSAEGAGRLVWRCGAIGVWLLAMGSKEIAATWPIAIWFWEWQVERQGEGARAFARRSLPWAFVFGVVGAAVVWAYAGGDPLADYRRKSFTLSERLWTEPRVWWSYVSLALAPLPSRLSVIHDVAMSRGLFTPWTTALALAGWLVVVVASVRSFSKHPALSAVAVWWLLQQVVEGTVLPLEPMYEHRTYLPMVGVSALAPWGLWRALGIRNQAARPVAIAAALGIAALALATVQRNAVWNDNVALWQDATTKAPARAVSHLNLGVSFLTVGRLDDARLALLEAVRLDANAHVAHQNLGSLAVGQGRFADAEPHFRRALAIEAADPISIAGMGAVAMEAGRPAEAIRLHERSLAIRVDPRVQTNLGQIFVVQGEFERGRRELGLSLEIDPRQPVAWRRLAEANEALGDFDAAARALEAFARYDPESWLKPDFVLRLADLYDRAGRSAHAKEVLVFAAQRARERGEVTAAEAFVARAAVLSGRPE